MPTKAEMYLAGERQWRALQMAARGANLEEIQRALGYGTRSGAWKALQRGLKEMHQYTVDAAEQYRDLQLSGMATLLRTAYQDALGGRRRVLDSNGTLVEIDVPPNLRAVETVLKIYDQMARLVGAYAPARSEVSGPGGGPIETQVSRNPEEVFAEKLEQLLKNGPALEELPGGNGQVVQ